MAMQSRQRQRSRILKIEHVAPHGFGHPGRFAVEYRQRYAETPSQTLLKSHRRAGA